MSDDFPPIMHKMTPPGEAPTMTLDEALGREPRTINPGAPRLDTSNLAYDDRGFIQGLRALNGQHISGQAADMSGCDHFDLSPSCQVGAAKGGLTFEKE